MGNVTMIMWQQRLTAYETGCRGSGELMIARLGCFRAGHLTWGSTPPPIHTQTDVILPSHECSITPIGTFDPKLGGHLVLKELKLIIEFPPSSTILIPSALLTHSNIPIREHETRFSIVQYAAGGLFRWVENGFMKDSEWHKVATADQEEQRQREGSERWSKAAAMFTKLNELMD